MPSRTKPADSKATNTKNSASRDLISLGSRHLTERRGKRGDEALAKERPTTTRALVLRDGKNGTRGAGEVIAVPRLTGREKLDLLAEDLLKRSKQAVMTPFRLDTCLKIAESQFASYLDDITNLKDPDLFHSLIEAELKARTLTVKKAEETMRDPASIASTISIKIHNAYLLASAWKIVADNLFDLQLTGVSDDTVVYKLRDEEFRSQYLVLYDMINMIVNLCQHKFSVLAATSPHYARYFKEKEGAALEFDRAGLREACQSFLDSIVIELCFPEGPYPKAILYQILHDAVEEAPKEAKRFPQSMWDSVGDLSEIVQLQDMLEAPLLGSNEATWRSTNRTLPKAYQQWANAEVMSSRASDKSDTLVTLVQSLSKLQNATALRNLWKQIQQNYMSVCNKDPDGIWGLTDALSKTTPSWNSYSLPIAEESDESDMPKLTGTRRKVLAITDGAESDDSMPPLQDVSESDESDSDWSNTDEEDDDEEDDESDYDTDEEDEVREMLREANDIAAEADLFADGPESENPFNQEDRKGNPFLKLLGSLRGRVFTNNPKLGKSATKATSKTTGRAKGTTHAPAPVPRKAPSQGTTMEEVEDEDDVGQGAGSKKKKKKLKKKKKPAATEAASPELPAAPAPAPVPAPVPSAASPPTAKPKPPPAKPRANPVASSVHMSTTSIPPVEPTVAQSGHSYAQNLDVKTKVKSRSDQPSLFAKGVLGRLGVGKDKSKQELESRSTKRNWFSSMHRKTKDYLHQILNTSEDVTKGSAGMKWDTFVKVMKDMGFTYVPSTAGSSVRFDPPNGRDRSITFHKPHPDSFIHPKMLKEFSKKLRRYYGWIPEDLD